MNRNKCVNLLLAQHLPRMEFLFAFGLPQRIANLFSSPLHADGARTIFLCQSRRQWWPCHHHELLPSVPMYWHFHKQWSRTYDTTRNGNGIQIT